MNKSLLITLATIVLGTALSGYTSPAAADIISVTVTGTVKDGIDTGGLFGTAGADLTGNAFTAQLNFDTSIEYIQSPMGSEADGGTIYGTASPALGASLTINGYHLSIAGELFGQVGVYDDGSQSNAYVEVDDLDPALLFSAEGYPGTSPASENGSFTLTPAANMLSGFLYDDLPDETLDFTPTLYVSTDVTDVPEPTSLALLGAILASVAVIRRKRA